MACADSGINFYSFIYSLSLLFTGPIFRRAFPCGAAFQPWCERLWGRQKCPHGIWLSACISRGEHVVLDKSNTVPCVLGTWWVSMDLSDPILLCRALSGLQQHVLLWPLVLCLRTLSGLCSLPNFVGFSGQSLCKEKAEYWYLTEFSRAGDMSLE